MVSFLAILAVAFILAIIGRAKLAEIYMVPSGSMMPTLQPGDKILVNKLDAHPPVRGQVVVFRLQQGSPPPSSLLHTLELQMGLAVSTSHEVLVKRVVAVGGQKVSCSNGSLFVNGALVNEPELAPGTQTTCKPTTVPKGFVFVMGDNRAHSADSRTYGPVPDGAIIGQVVARILPTSRMGTIKTQL